MTTLALRVARRCHRTCSRRGVRRQPQERTSRNLQRPELLAPGLAGAEGGYLSLDTLMPAVESPEAEELLEELPGTDDVADPNGDGSFTDVPELVSCRHGRGEVVCPFLRLSE